MIVPIVIGFYFTICVGVVLFNCWEVLSEYFLKLQYIYQKEKFLTWFQEDGSHYSEGTEEEQRRLVYAISKKLHSSRNLLIFQASMDEVREAEPLLYDGSVPMVAQIIQSIFPYYLKKSAIKQAYYSYIITYFQVLRYAPSEAIEEFLLDQIRKNKSIYNTENALRAIYSSGQSRLVLKAIKILDEKDEFGMHEKMVVDGLLTFSYPNEFIGCLWEHFNEFCSEMQVLLLNYIRFASDAWKKEVLALFNITDDMEIKIACIRYFGKYPEEQFRTILYRMIEELDVNDWEMLAVCMNVLASYPGEHTVQLLKKGLGSPNWYVRYNSADSLSRLSVTKEMVQDILDGDDRYAKHMLQYRLKMTTETESDRKQVAQ